MRFRILLAVWIIYASIFLVGNASGAPGDFNVSFKGGNNDDFMVSFPVSSDELNNVTELCFTPECQKMETIKGIIILLGYGIAFLIFLLLLIDYAKSQCCPRRRADSPVVVGKTIQKISTGSSESVIRVGQAGKAKKPLTKVEETIAESPV
ncbi:hypothetical protein TYRP_005550 [Tyrophagus putrescentiae]|nr:hypothetical protein TYRP_005550 [Tyrophagus putrescentiae]